MGQEMQVTRLLSELDLLSVIEKVFMTEIGDGELPGQPLSIFVYRWFLVPRRRNFPFGSIGSNLLRLLATRPMS